MKISILTSSRADYSIYYPLLNALKSDPFFSLTILAFGTHLSEMHGYTIKKIEEDGFEVLYSLHALPASDSPAAISAAMGRTMLEFSKVWGNTQFDLVFCLGDRYEMFAACASAMSFNIPLAHIHGGEETRGAIDDAFRHSITHMSTYHFTAAEEYRQRVIALKGTSENIYNVGSLSIDNLKTLKLLSISEFRERFHIDLSIPSILITFHPETVSYEKNSEYVAELVAALKEVNHYQLIITMPNADTMGNMIREELQVFIAKTPNAIGIESFGTLGYLSCMKHCSFMLGNTSSGFIEASYFPKYVIDLGSRQNGRVVTPNIKKCEILKEEILKAVYAFPHLDLSYKIDIYGSGTTSEQIIKILKARR